MSVVFEVHRHPPTFPPGNTYTSLKNAPHLEIPEVLDVESFDVYQNCSRGRGFLGVTTEMLEHQEAAIRKRGEVR